MEIDELLDQIGTALEVEDIPRARELLDEARAEFSSRYAWSWLRGRQPESYQQLTEKLELVGARYSPTAKTQCRQLAQIFQWCEEHGVELAELHVPENLHKYREAVAYLNDIRESGDFEALRTALSEIQGHKTRDKARAWAKERMKREKESG